MTWTAEQIATYLHLPLANIDYPNASIDYIVIDSRGVFVPKTSLFIALKGKFVDGHQFIPELYQKGVRNFLVSSPRDKSDYKEANFFEVTNATKALQQLASSHRRSFTTDTIAITGSVGKTILKEWLATCFHSQGMNIHKSPRSFNSQLGVPMSLLDLTEKHQLSIIEAGISQAGEMEILEDLINPNVGVLCHIDETHDEGFSSQSKKINEKLRLFRNCRLVICSEKNVAFPTLQAQFNHRLFYWSYTDKKATILVKKVTYNEHATTMVCTVKDEEYSILVSFLNKPDVENALLCLTTLYAMGIPMQTAKKMIENLHPTEVAWTISELNYNNKLIYDTQHADLHSLSLAFIKLKQEMRYDKYTIILSNLSIEKPTDDFYKELAKYLCEFTHLRLILIGEEIQLNLSSFLKKTHVESHGFKNTDSFIQQASEFFFLNEIILVLGDRRYTFDKIIRLLSGSAHSTKIKINLSLLKKNIQILKSYINPTVKLMGMVKAFGYGSGLLEIAQIIEKQNIDYLGVAYTDEGVELRKANINLPIMVMNPEADHLPLLYAHRLEAVIYSKWFFDKIITELERLNITSFPIHLKVDTGMHRLGVSPNEVGEIVASINQTPHLVLKSVFSHLSNSENPKEDSFTQQQAQLFKKIIHKIRSIYPHRIIAHLLNTSGMLRFSDYHFDMVRLGIGLYGIDPSPTGSSLQSILSLQTSIAQIKHVEKGERIGYGGKPITCDKKIATIRIGYADGFSRMLGNGHGFVFIRHQMAPVIGNVCMDMTMVDISNIPDVQLGDQVEIFGHHISFTDFCQSQEKSPYEVMSTFPSRLQKIYIEE